MGWGVASHNALVDLEDRHLPSASHPGAARAAGSASRPCREPAGHGFDNPHRLRVAELRGAWRRRRRQW